MLSVEDDDWVKTKTTKLVFAASSLSKQYSGVRADWLAWNHDNMSKRSNMSIWGLLFQWANTIASGMIGWSFPMKLNLCWIKISFSSNPKSFQILSVEIVNSSIFKLCNFTEVNISKYNAINSSCYINSKFQTGCSQICWPLYSYLQMV